MHRDLATFSKRSRLVDATAARMTWKYCPVTSISVSIDQDHSGCKPWSTLDKSSSPPISAPSLAAWRSHFQVCERRRSPKMITSKDLIKVSVRRRRRRFLRHLHLGNIRKCCFKHLSLSVLPSTLMGMPILSASPEALPLLINSMQLMVFRMYALLLHIDKH